MPLTPAEHDELTTILAALVPEADSLYGRSGQFVKDTQQRFEEYGDGTRMSPKQWEWLRSLYAKATGDRGDTFDKMQRNAMPDRSRSAHENTDRRGHDDMDDEIPY